MEATASFGEWVRQRRAALDLTQAELAKRVACAAITVRKIESDERRPSKAMAESLATALAIDPAERDRFVAVARAFVSPMRLPAPELAPATVATASLPTPLHGLVGRDTDVHDVSALLAVTGGAARLVTITGPPGVGKTRLALEVAAHVGREFDLAVAFVELAAATDAEGLRERVGSSVDVAGGMGTDRFDLARAAFGRVPTLLVLDNFEQLLGAAPQVGELLSSSPDLCCLVTSRSRLDIYGEHEYALEPLDLESAEHLFVERAMASRRDVDLASDSEQIIDICRRLDGLPLAIELAARRVRDLDVDTLASKLRTDLGVLGTGSRDRDERQRTMTGAVEWSYALMSASGQKMLRALTVTAGNVTTDATAAIAGEPVGQAETALEEIADQGLARRVDDRWSLFEVVRAVARTRLDDHGEASATRKRHAAYFLSVIETAAPPCIGAETREQLDLIEADYSELRTALAWSFDGGDPDVGRRTVYLLVNFWYPRCQWEEGRRWAELAYASSDAAEHRARSAFALGLMSFGSDPARATILLDEALTCAEAAGDVDMRGHLIGFRGLTSMMMGDFDTARAALDESGACFASVGNVGGAALNEMRLGRLAGLSGDVDGFESHCLLALEQYRALGTDFGAANVISDLSEIALSRGDLSGAVDHALEATRLLWNFGADWYAASNIELVANALTCGDDFASAARVYGMAEAWLDELGASVIPVIAQTCAEHRDRTESALGEDFAAFLDEGRRLPRTLDQVRRLALAS